MVDIERTMVEIHCQESWMKPEHLGEQPAGSSCAETGTQNKTTLEMYIRNNY